MPTGGSGAPVELVQRAGVTLPGAHVGIGPAAALAARQEVARPFAGDDNLRTPQVDAVRVTLADVEREGASAPALVHLTLGSQPAGAKHFAVTQLKTLSANVPGHC